MTLTYNTIIHKAKIKLMKDESYQGYLRKLSAAMREFIFGKLGLFENNSGSYMVETFEKVSISNVYQYGEGVKASDREKHYAVEYSRNTDGDFEFGEMTEVVRVTAFESVSDPKEIIISKDNNISKESVKKCFGNEKSKWIQTEKRFWNGVL